MARISITDRAGLEAAELASLSAVVSTHGTLRDVLDWCLSQVPPVLDTDVVTQDEFTHDVLVRAGQGRYLAYDAT